MTALVAVALTLVAIAGTAVALTAEPQRQAVTLSVFGLSLTLLFFTLQAPDVALSQLVIGAGVVPLVVMLTIRAMRRAELVRGGDE
ncbi:hydrogenase subunit MbhD domain-containing protein [Prescottella agglutinans]|uniref:hydrogenase subunit MbhD domain-containing protein n=1 Tax=Prescottella agglutinans TaxID=1644129 RepID=UPI003D993E12